jgi:hypothetical protein
MEAYCNTMRALKDKFYGIELNHVPRRYNKEADELAKIASGRITIPPNVFARDVARPSVNLELTPSNQEEPSGAPSDPTVSEPMDEDPSNEAFVLSLLEGYDAVEAEAMDEAEARAEDWQDKYIAWMDRRELPRTDPRPDASPGWPSHSPSSMESCTSATRQASCSGACPSLRAVSSFETFTRAYAATMQRHAPSWATRSARASTGPLRSLMPVRSCAPAKGASFMPARPTSPRTPSRQFPSHGPSPCGGWTSSGPCGKRPGPHPPTGCHRQILQVGRGAPNHECQGRVGRDVLHRPHLPVRGA